MRAKLLSSVLAMVAVGCLLACPTNPPNYPTKPIEPKYYATGPWTVHGQHRLLLLRLGEQQV